MRTCFCPYCGTNLKFEDDDRDFGFCQYCGAKITFIDSKKNNTAEPDKIASTCDIKNNEQEQKYDKETQIQQNEYNHKLKTVKLKLITSAVTYIVSLIFILTGVSFFQSTYENETLGFFLICIGILAIIIYACSGRTQLNNQPAINYRELGYIQLTSEALAFKGKNYRNIQSIYTKLGFKRIAVVNMKDLTAIYYNSRGLVESVTIDGLIPQKNQWYDPNAKVIIKYHGYDNR